MRAKKEYRYSLIEKEDNRLKLNLSLMNIFRGKELGNRLSSIVESYNGYEGTISYEEMNANVYNPLPSINRSTMQNEEEDDFSKHEKAKDGRFNQNLQYLNV